MPINDQLYDAISTNNVSELRMILETQDHKMFSQVAKNGSPDTATYLLDRSRTREDHGQYIVNPSPIDRPAQYLVRQSARNGNGNLFHYLFTRHPSVLSNRLNIDLIMCNAIIGGVEIWKILVELWPPWKDHEYAGHRGTVLQYAVEYGSEELVDFLLKKGVDTEALKSFMSTSKIEAFLREAERRLGQRMHRP